MAVTDVGDDGTASSDGTEVFSASARRSYLFVRCLTASPEPIVMTTEGTTPSATVGIRLAAGEAYERGRGDDPPSGAITVWSAGGAGTYYAIQSLSPI